MAHVLAAFIAVVTGVNAGAGEVEPGKDASSGNPLHPRVKMETSLGDIVLELNAEKAPLTVINFIQYAEDKFYDGTIFHRVMSTFMIQGGGFTREVDKKTAGLRSGIKNEWKNGLKNVQGTISMARTRQPDSATSQFFINVVDNANLDRPQRDGAAYCVFGKVVEGTETVEKIRNTAVGTHANYGGGRNKVVPVEPVIIKSVRLVSAFDRTKAQAAAKIAGQVVQDAQAQAKATKKQEKEQFVKELEEIKDKAVKTESGLMILDIVVGTGDSPQPTDKVQVHYTGWLTDGSKFDSSVDRGRPFTFSLTGGVIQGWLEGVGTMKVGGKRTLIIPPELGYGQRGKGATIPPNSVLVFEVELLGIAGAGDP